MDFFLFMYVIQYFYICRASDFTVTEGGGIGATHTALLPHKHHHPCFHTWHLHAALLPLMAPLILPHMTPLMLQLMLVLRKTHATHGATNTAATQAPPMLLHMALFMLHCCHSWRTHSASYDVSHAAFLPHRCHPCCHTWRHSYYDITHGATHTAAHSVTHAAVLLLPHRRHPCCMAPLML
jgi:hypothetical protein